MLDEGFTRLLEILDGGLGGMSTLPIRYDVTCFILC